MKILDTTMKEFSPKPFGKYYLMRLLSQGDQYEFYLAKTFGVNGFEKTLVIKRLLPHFSANKESITRMIEEAKIVVLLNHNNVVQYYDLGMVGDDYFISMEYINGINLEKIILHFKTLNKKVPEDALIYILSEACNGLKYIHSKKDKDGNLLNLTHNNICPSNIMLGSEGEVKITGFSQAAFFKNDPERYKKDLIDVGSTLYEMLCGEKLNPEKVKTENDLPGNISLPLRVLLKKLLFEFDNGFGNAWDIQLELLNILSISYTDFNLGKLYSWVQSL